MGSTRDKLAWLLSNTSRIKALEKIGSVIKMETLENVKQSRGFSRAVNYYRNMWPREHMF